MANTQYTKRSFVAVVVVGASCITIFRFTFSLSRSFSFPHKHTCSRDEAVVVAALSTNTIFLFASACFYYYERVSECDCVSICVSIYNRGSHILILSMPATTMPCRFLCSRGYLSTREFLFAITLCVCAVHVWCF